jgi:hypothetical protein
MEKNKLINLTGIILLIIGGLMIGLRLNSSGNVTDFLSNSANGFLIVALGLGFLVLGSKRKI